MAASLHDGGESALGLQLCLDHVQRAGHDARGDTPNRTSCGMKLTVGGPYGPALEGRQIRRMLHAWHISVLAGRAGRREWGGVVERIRGVLEAARIIFGVRGRAGAVGIRG